MLLPLYLEVACKLPCVLDDGSTMSKEELVRGLQADTLRYGCDLGMLQNQLPQAICFSLQVELGEKGEGFSLAAKWLRRVLYLTRPTAEHLRMAVQRQLTKVPAAARDGKGVVQLLSEGEGERRERETGGPGERGKGGGEEWT